MSSVHRFPPRLLLMIRPDPARELRLRGEVEPGLGLLHCPFQALRILEGQPARVVPVDRCRAMDSCCAKYIEILQQAIRARPELRGTGSAPVRATPGSRGPDTKAVLPAERLRRICLDLLRRPIRGSILQALAQALGSSERQVARLFLAAGLDSPAREFRRLRLLKARDQPLESSCSLEEFAEGRDYCDGASFSRAFKRAFGNSPGILRSTRGAPGRRGE